MSAFPKTAFLVAVSRPEVLDDICALIQASGEALFPETTPIPHTYAAAVIFSYNEAIRSPGHP